MIELPRVTDILKSSGLINGDFFTEESRDRGTYIHRATVIDEQGDLDEDFEPTRRYMGHILGWRKFLAEHKCSWSHVEERMEHATFRYCGTPDRAGRVDGVDSVVDIKSGAALPFHKYQLAAYQAFFKPGKYLRLVVRLQEDGTYRVDPYGPETYFQHINVFVAALTIHNTKKMEGIL
jgi:hypothetical protein